MRNRSNRLRHAVSMVASLVALVAASCGSSGSTRASADAGRLLAAAVSAPSGTDTQPAASSNSRWTEALASAGHEAATGFSGPTSGHILWQRSLGAPVVGGAIAAPDGTVYASANNGVLHALDPANGRDRWTFGGAGSTDNNEDLSTSPALLADGTILWPAPGGRLEALSPAGHLIWTVSLTGTVLSPAVVGDHVYVSDTQGDIASISPTATRGEIRWSLKLGKVSFGSPAVGPDGTIYTTVDNRLVAVEDLGSKSTVRWTFEPHSNIEVSPSVAPDGTVVLGTNDGFEYGITPHGTVRWRYPLGKGIFSYSTPAVTADDLAYFGDNNGVLHVVNAGTGAVIGRYVASSRALSSNGIGVWTAPAVDGRHDVYFGTASGHIFGFTYDGSQLFDLATGGIVASYPALVDDGLLVIGSDNGTLYAFAN